jgi:hypothetical protein
MSAQKTMEGLSRLYAGANFRNKALNRAVPRQTAGQEIRLQAIRQIRRIKT